jgi:hypothetical protein
MTNGDMALRLSDATDGTDLARKQYLSTEYQEAVAQDESVKTAYPLAVELVFVTMLTQIEDAEALAADLLELFSTRRDRLTFPTFFNDGNIELGLTVTVQLTNRLRFNAGKNMLVVSREDNYTQRIRVLTLWG